MSRTNRRVVLAVREDSSRAVERKLNEHVFQSPKGWGKVDLVFHPGNNERAYVCCREARLKARLKDLFQDYLGEAFEDSPETPKLPVLGLWKAKFRRVRFFGPPQFKF